MPLIILKWKNWLAKVHRIHENGTQNLQVTCTEFSIFWCRILTTLHLSLMLKGIHVLKTSPEFAELYLKTNGGHTARVGKPDCASSTIPSNNTYLTVPISAAVQVQEAIIGRLKCVIGPNAAPSVHLQK